MISTITALCNRPLLVLALSFAAGDAAHAIAPHSPAVPVCAAAAGIALFARGSARRWAAAAGLALMGFAIGAFRLASYQALPVTDISHWAGSSQFVTVTGSVVSEPDVRHGVTTFVIRADQVLRHGQTIDVTGEAWVSVNPDRAWGRAAREDGTSQPVADYGDRITVTGRLDTPLAATNPGGFSWKDYLVRRAIACELRARRPSDVVHCGSGGNLCMRLAARVRQRLLDSLQASLPPISAALLSGILIGARANLPPNLMADFIHTGTVHILASAGLHVGVVAFWLLRLGQMLTLPRKLSAGLIILLLVMFVLLAGGRPAVSRAVLMACFYFGAVLFEREPDLATTFGGAALIILAIQPTELFEPGFQLSFLTVFTLIMAMPVWETLWRRLVTNRISNKTASRAARWAGEMTGLSLIAQLGAMPVVAYYNNEISLGGLLANLCIVPTLFVLIPLGFIGFLLWTVWHAGGMAVLGLAGLGLQWVARTVHGFASESWAYYAIPSPDPVVIAAYYAVMAVICRFIGARLAAMEQQGNELPS